MADGSKMLKSVTVKRRKDAPIPLIRGSAAASADEGKCYFMSYESDDVRMYDMEKDDWFALRKCPYKEAGFVVIDGLLTAVGGRKQVGSYWEYTNKLHTLSNRRWSEKFPPMPLDPALGVDSRYMRSSVVQSEDSLIVVGAEKSEDSLKKVNVLNMKTSEWSELCELPDRQYYPTAVICGDELYSVGGRAWPRAYQCFLDELLDPSKTDDVWTRIADTPYIESTCASLCGQLVAVGGRMNDICDTIHAYDPSKDSWYSIGKLALGRSKPLVLTLSENTLLVVGGASPIGRGDTTVAELVTGITG